MPFAGQPYPFDAANVSRIYEIGGVYGLFAWNPTVRKYICLYVGQSDNIRRRILEHHNRPPVIGPPTFLRNLTAMSIAEESAKTN